MSWPSFPPVPKQEWQTPSQTQNLVLFLCFLRECVYGVSWLKVRGQTDDQWPPRDVVFPRGLCFSVVGGGGRASLTATNCQRSSKARGPRWGPGAFSGSTVT